MASFECGSVPFVPLPSGRSINPNILFSCVHYNDKEKSAQSFKKYKESTLSAEKEKELPPPASFRAVEDIPLSPCKFSSEYKQFRPPSADEFDNLVEYEEDELDHHWLSALNEQHKKKKNKPLTTELFCQVMDRLEKESTFQPKSVSGYTNNSPDDVCCVCGDGEDDNVNMIVYCDMCNIAVHQDCYGVPYIPEGSWLCRRCRLSPSKPTKCALCPNMDGAFKPDAQNKHWAHVICVIWLNEVHFQNPVFLEPVEGIRQSLEARSKLRCMICKKKEGACIQCSQRSCVRSFHVTCAQASGMYMKVETADDSDSSAKMDVQRFAYCHLHDPSDPEDDPNVRKRKMEDAFKKTRRILKKRKSRSVPVNMPVIEQSKVNAIGDRFSVSNLIRTIHDYWYLKRKSRCGVPLIRRLQAELENRAPVAPNPLDDPEMKDVMLEYSYKRNDLEKVRMLSEIVKKREEAKRKHVDHSFRIFESCFKPLEVVLEEVIDMLNKRDKHQVFAYPVDVQGYDTVISRPMDLFTMKTKLGQGKYKSLSDLKKDFDLMCDNCDKFNKEQPYYLNHGKRMRKKGNAVFEMKEVAVKGMEELLQSNDNILQQTARIMFYSESGEEEEEKVKENAPVDQTPSVFGVRGPSVDHSVSSPQTHSNPFLVPRSSALGGGSAARQKRKNDEGPTTPVSKRKKKEDDGLHQSSITKFFTASTPSTPSQSSENRRSLRQTTTQNPATTTPFSSFRNNSMVQSPLAADVPSSAESATDDDETETMKKKTTTTTTPIRTTRRRTRMEQARTDIRLDSPNSFMHNDIVVVSSGAIGRVLLPTHAVLDDLPNDLRIDCREGWNKRNNEDELCVYHFGDGKRPEWGWYRRDQLRVVDFDNDTLPHSKPYRMAREYRDSITRLVPVK